MFTHVFEGQLVKGGIKGFEVVIRLVDGLELLGRNVEDAQWKVELVEHGPFVEIRRVFEVLLL